MSDYLMVKLKDGTIKSYGEIDDYYFTTFDINSNGDLTLYAQLKLKPEVRITAHAYAKGEWLSAETLEVDNA